MSVSTSPSLDNRHRRGAFTVAALVPALMLSSSIAHATVAGAVGITLQESSVTVGQGGLGIIALANASTGAEGTVVNYVDQIRLTPSCKLSNGSCVSGSQDPVVFELLASGTGLTGSTCSGISFAISLIDASLGLWQFTPAAPIPLPGPGAFCRIAFNYRTLNRPRVDADETSDGSQTQAVASARFAANGQEVVVPGVSSLVTVLRGCSVDFDGDGKTDALTDGLLLLRALFGLSGSAATSGVVAGNATRKTWSDISAHLNSNCGTKLN